MANAKIRFLGISFFISYTDLIASSYNYDGNSDSVFIQVPEQEVAKVIAQTLSEEKLSFIVETDKLLEDRQNNSDSPEMDMLAEKYVAGIRSYFVDYEITDSHLLNDEHHDQMFKKNNSVIIETNVRSKWKFIENKNFKLIDESYEHAVEGLLDDGMLISCSSLTFNVEGDFIEGLIRLSYEFVSSLGDKKESYEIIKVISQNLGLLDIADFEFLYEIDLESGSVEQICRKANNRINYNS